MIDLVLDDIQGEIERTSLDAASRLTLRSGDSLDVTERRTLGDLGVFGSGLAEHVGGAGCGARAEVIVAQAFGRCLAPIGILGSMLAAHVLVDVDDRTHDALLAEVLAGIRGAGIGVRSGATLRAVDMSGPGLLTVVERDRVHVVEVDDDADIRAHASIDHGATVREVVGEARVIATSTVPATLIRSTLLPAAMAAGVAAVATERAVEYAKHRHQYGKPIGSFQAVKHRCVDMALRTEAATSLVRLTASRLDAGEPDFAATSAALVIGAEAARLNASSAVQVFGGIGFTAEGGLQHLIHRAWMLENLCGGSAQHLDHLVEDRRAKLS